MSPRDLFLAFRDSKGRDKALWRVLPETRRAAVCINAQVLVVAGQKVLYNSCNSFRI